MYYDKLYKQKNIIPQIDRNQLVRDHVNKVLIVLRSELELSLHT